MYQMGLITNAQHLQLYSTIYRKPDALYLSYKDRGHLADIMSNWPQKDVRIAVVSDGSRILGLGDLGIGGCQISVGKLTLVGVGVLESGKFSHIHTVRRRCRN